VPPRVRELAALEHDVIERLLSEEVTGGEAGMTCAYDNGREVLDVRRPRP
jgi:hypothetical protein